MSAEGSCPGCGAPIEFRVATSVVAVCAYCRQVVARGGVDVEDLGKSNEILALPSALRLGARGTFRAHSFTVVGRTQLAHPLGGHWNEWYAVLENHKWVWIAEHQGRIAVLGEVSAAQAPGIRALEAAEPGSRWLSGRGEFVVVERGLAVVHAEEGELPWRAAPNERRAYVDLSSPGGGFATLDFGVVGDDERPRGPRRFFVGHEATVEELALEGPAVVETRKVQGARAVSCPKCAAGLQLKRPDETKTIVCGSCGSALSVDEEKDLGFLFAQTIGVRPVIPLGSRARFDERVARVVGETGPVDVEVAAFVVRSVIEDGETFFYYEYLLASDKHGLLWLVDTEGAWVLFRPVPAAEVEELGAQARFRGRTYRMKAAASPVVEQVLGELHWRVKKGDRSSAKDYTATSGARLSVEKTRDEVNWTHGGPVARPLLAEAFGMQRLVPATTSAGGSPYTYPSSSYSSYEGSTEASPGVVALVFMLFVLMIVLSMCGDCGGGSSYGGGGHYGGGYGGGGSFGK